MEDLTNIYLYFIHNDLIHIFCLFSDQKQYTEGCRRRFGDELYIPNSRNKKRMLLI